MVKSKWLLVVWIGFFLLVAALLFGEWQRYMIFMPSRDVRHTPRDFSVKFYNKWIEVPSENGSKGGLVHAWWLPAARESAPAVLYLHGENSTMSTDLDRILGLYKSGFSVMAIDYRGYGKSQSAYPTEGSVYEDARAAWEKLVQWSPGASKYVLYGRDLGSAIAIDLAAQKTKLNALVVEGGFSSMAEAATAQSWSWLPIAWLPFYKFDSIEKIKKIEARKWFIHCNQETPASTALGWRLHQSSNGEKEWLMLGGEFDGQLCKHGFSPEWAEAMRRVAGS